jgi:polyphosphate kinase
MSKTKKQKHNNAKRKTKSNKKLSVKKYEQEIIRLQTELCHLQEWVKHKGIRAVVIFEGRDAAGKGGVIKRITERVSPRVFRTVALPPPSDREKTQLYAQRYMPHLPAAGEVIIFDRSWYNRAGVERVMGFCTDDEYHSFIKNAPLFERHIVSQGIILIKYFFDVSREVQQKRFLARIKDPMRHWKLSPMDVESWRRWWDYTDAYAKMIEATDTEWAPWFRVHADSKRRARLNCISHLLSMIPYKKLPFEPPKPAKRKRRSPDGAERIIFANEVPEIF